MKVATCYTQAHDLDFYDRILYLMIVHPDAYNF